MSRPIPERVVNFAVYPGAGGEMLGMTDVELPSFEAMTETISGAGIAGEYASPTIGHFGSQKLKLKWRTLTLQAIVTVLPQQRALFDIRGAVQIQDPMLGKLVTQALRVECTGQMTTFGLGKVEPGKVMGVESDIEIAKIKISLDGVPLVELDKFNMKYVVNGVDLLAPVRQALGGA